MVVTNASHMPMTHAQCIRCFATATMTVLSWSHIDTRPFAGLFAMTSKSQLCNGCELAERTISHETLPKRSTALDFLEPSVILLFTGREHRTGDPNGKGLNGSLSYTCRCACSHRRAALHSTPPHPAALHSTPPHPLFRFFAPIKKHRTKVRRGGGTGHHPHKTNSYQFAFGSGRISELCGAFSCALWPRDMPQPPLDPSDVPP